MAHRVVKPFPFSEDGFTLVDLNVGDERDFGDMTGGLEAEGWIEAMADVEPVVDGESAAKPAKRTK